MRAIPLSPAQVQDPPLKCTPKFPAVNRLTANMIGLKTTISPLMDENQERWFLRVAQRLPADGTVHEIEEDGSLHSDAALDIIFQTVGDDKFRLVQQCTGGHEA